MSGPSRSAPTLRSARLAGLVVLAVASAPGAAHAKSYLLPWIEQARGAVARAGDLYLGNPGSQAMQVTLEFRKRGLPEANPPRATRTLQPHATLFIGDALPTLFGRESASGFVIVSSGDAGADLVPSAFTRTALASGGASGGHRIGGLDVDLAAGPGASQFLIGLQQDASHLAAIWLYNPSAVQGDYRLTYRAFDGGPLGTLSATLPPGGMVIVRPKQHPLSPGSSGRFSVEAAVFAGSLLSSAEVTGPAGSDPVHVPGETR